MSQKKARVCKWSIHPAAEEKATPVKISTHPLARMFTYNVRLMWGSGSHCGRKSVVGLVYV